MSHRAQKGGGCAYPQGIEGMQFLRFSRKDSETGGPLLRIPAIDTSPFCQPLHASAT